MSAIHWRSMNEWQLAALFRRLGADDPKARARAQIEKGIADLPRDLFLMLAVSHVIRPWRRDWLTEPYPRGPDEPGGELRPAVDRLLAAGAPVKDLTTIVGLMQMWLVLALCELLEDPGELEPEVADIRWRLFLCDTSGSPEAPIMGLAETLMEEGSTEDETGSIEQGEAKAPALGRRLWQAMNEQELAELFGKLGADDPAGWARSQINQGIPQLLRYLFLRQAWSKVIGPDDRGWMTELFKDDPEGEDDFAQAVDAVLSTSAPTGDLTTVVRISQWRVLFSFCTLLDDILVFRVGGRYVPLRDLSGFRWRLFQVDENGAPHIPIEGLHESVLETDPTGREMRPSAAKD